VKPLTSLGGKVRWLDDGAIGDAVPERDKRGTWLGTFTVFSPNPVTGGTREDRGAILGMHIEPAGEHPVNAQRQI
jgi:hypothetical protein